MIARRLPLRARRFGSSPTRRRRNGWRQRDERCFRLDAAFFRLAGLDEVFLAERARAAAVRRVDLAPVVERFLAADVVRFRVVDVFRFAVVEVLRFRDVAVLRLRVVDALRLRVVAVLRLAAVFREAPVRVDDLRPDVASPPLRPPLRAEAVLVFLPRPDPLFLPPPVSLFTVAQARRPASFFPTPRFS
jgi:hypothetical protein